MNMKRIFMIGLLMTASFFYAQKLPVSITESKVYRMTTPRVQNDYIIPDAKGGFVSISTKRSGFLANPLVLESYIAYYNNDLEQIKTKTIKLNKGSLKGSIKGAFIADEKLNMINLETNYRQKFISFSRLTADLKADEVKEKEFFRIKGIYPKNEVNLYVNLNSLYYEKLKYYSDVNFFNPKIFIKFSDDHKYFAIIYRDFDKTKTRYLVNVFNQDFQQVNSQIIQNNTPAKMFYINDIVVDNEKGNVFVVAKIYKTDPFLKNKLVNKDNIRNFILYKLSQSGVQSFEIHPEKVMEELHLIYNKELVVYGFYRKHFLDLNDIDGVFRMNIHPGNFHKTSQMYEAFTDKLLSTSYKKSFKKTKNHKMIVRKSYLLEDGSLLINSEDFYIPMMKKRKDREALVREIVGDLFSIKINNQGHVLWAKRVYKVQVVKPRLALHSYFSALHNGNNYILYTDTRQKKPEKNASFYMKDKDLQNLYGIKINTAGAIQQAVVKENTKSKFRFMPIEGTMISKDEAIIPAKNHLMIKFYKIKFEK